MYYPDNFEEKISFDQIRELLKSHCSSSLGLGFVDKMKFSVHFGTIEKLVKQTEEFVRILQLAEPFPSSGYIDIFPFLKKARIEGAFLASDEFYDLKVALNTLTSCLKFFSTEEKKLEYPLLSQVGEGMMIHKGFMQQLDRVIDEKGAVRANASTTLQQIRSSHQQEQVHLRKTLDSILRSARQQGYTPEGVSLTIRSGRMVIPVLAEYKRRIKGFVHDESATGQTVYLEPTEVLETNNRIRELEYAEHREIVRILTALTDALRPHIEDLKRACQILAMFDFIRAKARFAIQIEAAMPSMVKEQVAKWHGVRHPLLMLSHQKQGKPIVPLHIILDEEQKIIVISGPNAGGKSVTLKTVALVQYMFQCGLLVPMDSHATMGVFHQILLDIGDEQSIENDLSTYSSHLMNMRYFVTLANRKSLFLIDEFGAGTEPNIGGAIAEAILENLYHQKAFGVVTTHYANLKKFAEKKPGVVNAAMRYDVDKLEPLYELEIGKPGSSFALEIAHKIGLPKAILQKVKQNAGYQQVNFDKMLAQLEKEKSSLEQSRKMLEKRQESLQHHVDEYQTLKQHLESQKKTLIQAARQEAKQLLQDTNQRIEATIREIKENKAEKSSTQKVRKALKTFEATISNKEDVQAAPAPVTTTIKRIDGAIEVGDQVRITGQETIGEVLDIKGKEAVIAIGELRSTVRLKRLERVSKKDVRTQERKVGSPMKGINLNEKMANFSSKIDVRGKRAEAALMEVDEFLDTALMLNMPELTILHGKGDGILRDILRNFLLSNSHVASAQDEHVDRGGSGITIVRLRS